MAWTNPNADSDRTVNEVGSMFDSQPCLAEHPVSRRLHPIYGVMAFAMPSGVMVQHPMNWRDIQYQSTYASCINGFQCAMGLTQNHLLGTPAIKSDLLMGLTKYEDLHTLMFDEKHKPLTHNYINSHFAREGTTTFNPTMAVRLAELYASSSSSQVPPADTIVREEADAMEEAQAARELHRLFGGGGSGGGGGGGNRGEEEDEEEEEDDIPMPVPAADTWFRQLQAEEEDNEDDATTLDWVGGPGYEPQKLSGLVVRLHEEGHPDACAGFILYILVHDPMWNAGQGIEQLADIVAAAATFGTSKAPSSLTPTQRMAYDMELKRLPNTHFLKEFNQDAYRTMVLSYLRMTDSSVDMVSRLRPYHDENHPLHPLHVFTPARALQAIECINPRIDLTVLRTEVPILTARSTPLFFYHHPLRNLRLPPTLARSSYFMQHEQLMWLNPTRIGMAHQFLPWSDGHLEIVHRETPNGPPVATLSTRTEQEEVEYRILKEKLEREGVLCEYSNPERQVEQTKLYHRRKQQITAFKSHLMPQEHLNWFHGAHRRFGNIRSNIRELCPTIPVYVSLGLSTTTTASVKSQQEVVHHRAQLESWLQRGHNAYCDTTVAMEQQLMPMFISRLWSMDAIQPSAILNIIHWHKHGDGIIDGKKETRQPGFTHIQSRLPFLNKHWDPFANFVQQRAFYVKYLDKTAAHGMTDMILCSYARYDPYDATPGIHISLILHGPAGTGKSFVLDRILEYSIPDSVAKRNSQSLRADNFIEDLSGALFMYDELPNDMKKNVNDGEKSTEFKSASVDQKIIRVVNSPKGQDGRDGRKKEYIITYYGSSWWWASNVPLHLLEDAVISRTIPLTHMDYKYTAAPPGSSQASTTPTHSILDYVVHKDGTGVMMKKHDYKLERWIEQCIVTMIHKAIESIVLPEVDMRVFDYVIYKLLGTYKKHGISPGNIRKYEMTKRLARQMVVVQAFYQALSNPYDHCNTELLGEVFENKREFKEEELLRMKPHLVCSMQMAVFAFSTTAHQYVDPLLSMVFEALLLLIDYPIEEQREFIQVQDALIEAANDDQVQAVEGIHSYAIHYYLEHANNKKKTGIWRTSDNGTYLELDYVRVYGGNMAQLAIKLSSMMNPSPAKEDIETILYRFTKMAMRLPSHGSIPVFEFDHRKVEHSFRKLQVMEPVFDGNGQEKGIFICPRALEALSSKGLLERAVRGLAYKGMHVPRTFVLGNMKNLNDALFKEITITEEDCRNSKQHGFIMSSANYVPRRERMGIFMQQQLLLGADVGVDGQAPLEDRWEEEEEDHYDQDGNPLVRDPDESQREAVRQMSAPYYETMSKRLGMSHTQKNIVIAQDLDEWAVGNYFAEQGIPLCLNEQDEHDLTLYWRYTTRNGTVVRRPLPTAWNIQQEMIRQVRTNDRLCGNYNLQYMAESSMKKKKSPVAPTDDELAHFRHFCLPPNKIIPSHVFILEHQPGYIEESQRRSEAILVQKRLREEAEEENHPAKRVRGMDGRPSHVVIV